MRLSSAFSRWTIVSALLSFMACASAPPAVERQRVSSLEGELAVIGEHPFDRRIVLVDGESKFWSLINPLLHGELLNLAGHRIRVTGFYENAGDGGLAMRVHAYEMLPVEGKTPIVGTLLDDGTRIVLVERTTQELYIIAGPLSEALSHFQGFKVWAYGDEKQTYEDTISEKILVVQGYGIIGPLERTSLYAPSDTLRDLNNR